MDYESIAVELLRIRAELSRTPEHQTVSEFARGEFFVLNYMMENDGSVYPKDLSREMNVSSARVAAVLNQTGRKGLTERSSDADDSRKTLVTITDRGREAVMDKKKEIFDFVVEMLREIGPEDAQELLRIKKKIIMKKRTRGEIGE
ncbi:MAG: winged helix DNA-binding protein [Clostridiales bacterium]|nr:winged helix DNA-binding protein [Clostridiales bacterium]MDD7035451.1 winged helix DNA-binding protein [Bacillota bacterium]MDY2919966.1 winged helix DNA-binding protein [Lentihominibacter sp.]